MREGNSQDAGRGRLIPKYPWENVVFPVSKWLGLEDDQEDFAFPNLENFNKSTHFIETCNLSAGTRVEKS